MRSPGVTLVLAASTLACGGGGSTSPAAVPMPMPTPTPTPTPVSCSTVLRACPVSLRFSATGACASTACLQPIAALLEANGVIVNRPFPDSPMTADYGHPGCVGTRADLGGTFQEAECLVQLLGSDYNVDRTGCRVDGYPHMVVAR